MKVVKVLLVVVGVLAVIAGAGWQLFLKDEVENAQIGLAYAAKQVCSCRFVSSRRMTQCQGDFLTDISQATLTEDGESINASALGGLVSATATHTEGLGCVLKG